MTHLDPNFLPIPGCHAMALRKAARRVSLLYDTLLAPTGLRVGQVGTLATLARQQEAGISINELAVQLVMDRSTVGQNLRPLIRDGWVRLNTDPMDRRTRRVLLTAAGWDKYREAVVYWQQAEAALDERFGAQSMGDLSRRLLAIALDDRLGEFAETATA